MQCVSPVRSIAPLLVFAWGNASRGDDALGPLCVERLRALDGPPGLVDFLEDYQLQVEHALDLGGRRRVLFIDASRDCEAPFQVSAVQPRRDASFSSHALSPQALLQVFVDLHRRSPPPCTLLALRGESFELGAAPSAQALRNLDAALSWALRWLQVETDGASACVQTPSR